jgi:hypothetical protein
MENKQAAKPDWKVIREVLGEFAGDMIPTHILVAFLRNRTDAVKATIALMTKEHLLIPWGTGYKVNEFDYAKKTEGSLFSPKQAKLIAVPKRFLNHFVEMIRLAVEKMYEEGTDDQKLLEIRFRPYYFAMDRSTIALLNQYSERVFRRGDLEFDAIHIGLEYNMKPRHHHYKSDIFPLLQGGETRLSREDPSKPAVKFFLNPELTKAEALDQFNPTNPCFFYLVTTVEHELVHTIDEAIAGELSKFTGNESIEEYFNTPMEMRAYSVNLVREFEDFILKSHFKTEQVDQLLVPFLRGSHYWAMLSEHLNSANRELILKELREAINDRDEELGAGGG